MMQKMMPAALLAAMVVGTSVPAAAQSRAWEDRVFAGVSFGLESGSTDITDARTRTIYAEPASITTTSSFDSDSILDFQVGARVYGNVGVSLAYHAESSTAAAQVSGSIPHPLFFDRPRSFSNEIDGVDRDEHATHLQIGYMVPLNDKIDMYVYGGPSFFRVKQELVSDVAVAEQGAPFNTVVVQPTFQEFKKNATGYNVGVDLAYMFMTTDTLRLGVGGFARLTKATAELTVDGATVETDLGGFQVGIGARIRF
ncbi:MAG: outer membrane beta-barrel protein [Acidobacteria bacterium]|nr:outer membrane beta-barrel protein [Acidobacteriota bacterium]